MIDDIFKQTVKVAVIDDNAEFGAGIKMLLSKEGVEVITAVNGPEGLDLVIQHVPDIVLLDVVIPGIDGLEFCKKIKKLPGLKGVYIIMLSGVRVQTDQMSEGLEAGADGYITRPIPNRELLARLRVYIRLKRAEKALEKNEDRLAKIMMAANDGMWDWDLRTNQVYFDPRYYQMSGYDVDEFPHKLEEFQKRVHPGDVDYVMSEAEKHLKGEIGRFDVKFKFLKKSGDWQWIQGKGIIVERDENGVPQRFVGTHRDISDLKQVEEILRSNYTLLQIAGETARFGGWEVDLKNNICTWSDIVADIHEMPHGYAPSVQEGISFYAPEWQEKITQVFNDCAQKGISYDEEMEIITKKGKRLWVRTIGRAVKDENGKISKVQGSFQDISESKKAIAELSKREEMMRGSQSVAHIGSYSTNLNLNELEKSTWVCSPEFYKIFGIDEYYPHTVEGWAGFIHPDYREEMIAYHNSIVKEKKSYNRDYKIIRINDGAERWVHGTGELEFDKKGTPVRMHGSIQDITERKREEIIRHVQYSIAEASLTAKNPGQLYDLIKNELNRVVDLSNFFIAIFNEETGMLSSILEKDEKDEIAEWPSEKSATGYLINKGQPVLLKRDDILRLKNEGIIEIVGTISEAWLGVPLKIEGKIIGAVVVQNYDNPDVYDKYSIEMMGMVAHLLSMYMARQLAEERANKLSRAVEQSSVEVVITNRDGDIEYVNPFFTKLTGYSFSEVKGKNPSILKSGHHSAEFYHELWDTILSGNNWEGELLNKTKAGELYWLEAVISPIVNSERVITNFVSIRQNITERKRMHEELVAAKVKAEESDKLKTSFLHNISHEIRTPMNAIIGFSALLSEPELSKESKTFYIDTITQSSNQLLAIINDIVDISNIEAGIVVLSKKEIRVNESLKRVEELFSLKSSEKGIALRKVTPLPDKEAIILADNTKFIQVFSNLLANAFKFTAEGTIEFGYKPGKDFIEFYVSDTGTGIPGDQLTKIFDRFYQVDYKMDRMNQGTGLGLSISKSYVELMGGQIWVISELGKGSTFFFTLPACKSVQKKETVYQRYQKHVFEREYNILVAEDDKQNSKLIDIFLAIPGLKVTKVYNGVEAVEHCRTGKPVDLVLLDLNMPVMNGFEATELIRESLPQIPIIAQTAYSSEADRERAIKSGCNDFITKPFSKETLLSKIIDNLHLQSCESESENQSSPCSRSHSRFD
jgi:PAS domain S-box-containing protein